MRLQALIRGQAVRRQTASTLRGLESLLRIQARHRSSRAGGIDQHQAAEGDADALLLLRRGRELCAAAAAAAVQVSHTMPVLCLPDPPCVIRARNMRMIGAAHARHVGNCG